MRRLPVCAGTFALVAGAIASPALAVYRPYLTVTPGSTAPSITTSLTIGFVATNRGSDQPITDDPTARIDVDIPAGYAISTGQPIGARLGPATAKYEIRREGVPPTTEYLSGTVNNADPVPGAANSCAPGSHDGVFVATFDVAGQPMAVPIYFDGRQTGDSSGHLTTCFAAPSGTAPFHGRFFTFEITLNRALRTPNSTGTSVWRGFFTPFDQQWSSPAPSRTVESQSLTKRPAIVTVAARLSRGRVVVTGSVLAAGQPAVGVDVLLYLGKRLNAMTITRLHVRTDAYGRFKIIAPGQLRQWVRVNASNGNERETACVLSSLAPGGCVLASVSYYSISSRVVKSR
jgi:hypothetical protein